MRLCNPKTKTETGFDYVVNSLFIRTPYGKKRVKEISAFEPGREGDLRQELLRLEKTVDLIRRQPDLTERLYEVLHEIKDNTLTIKRSANNVLSVVELYEIKTLLLQMDRIRNLLAKAEGEIPAEFLLQDVTELLDVLDPGKERINTFYIYDVFSEKLAALRADRRKIELDIRKVQRELKRKVEAAYGIIMTPKFEYMVPKTDKQLMDKARGIPELSLQDEDYMTAIFTLAGNDEVDRLKRDMEVLNEAIEEEELQVQEELSKKVGQFRSLLLENCAAIGELDFNLAKASFALNRNCVKPEIVEEHVLELVDGRQLVVEEILQKKGKEFCPVTIVLKDGVTCITGANMGGKTISLKMVGQCAILAQHGFYVPCTRAKIGLSSYVHILIGDSQNVQRGLSSFGSEMEELKEILDRSKDRALLLIDEIASGTNPVEGLALTKSIVNYLSQKAYISVITTHFDNVFVGGKTRNMQVRGLADVDFELLSREIRYANRRERIEIIGKYMDYRLYEVADNKEIPKDALNIAQMLGIDRDIIEQARKYMEDPKDEK
ncbi:MAG: MutS-related protein [Anaerovoracaceae bacterium]|jgi:DNA mismatch repair protein MutS2